MSGFDFEKALNGLNGTNAAKQKVELPKTRKTATDSMIDELLKNGIKPQVPTKQQLTAADKEFLNELGVSYEEFMEKMDLLNKLVDYPTERLNIPVNNHNNYQPQPTQGHFNVINGCNHNHAPQPIPKNISSHAPQPNPVMGMKFEFTMPHPNDNSKFGIDGMKATPNYCIAHTFPNAGATPIAKADMQPEYGYGRVKFCNQLNCQLPYGTLFTHESSKDVFSLGEPKPVETPKPENKDAIDELLDDLTPKPKTPEPVNGLLYVYKGCKFVPFNDEVGVIQCTQVDQEFYLEKGTPLKLPKGTKYYVGSMVSTLSNDTIVNLV